MQRVVQQGILASLGLVLGTATLVGIQTERTAWDGVYTEDQANRGRILYEGNCSSCHGDRLMGFDDAPPLVGEYFLVPWRGLPLSELFVRIRSTMPGGSPGSLSVQAYADVVAYLLQRNEFPSGRVELSAEETALQEISITERE